MNQKYIVQKQPFVVPTDDGKVIKEHFGNASLKEGNYSLAHMIAPPGWSEPYQTPDFDEITFVFSGKKQFEIDDEKIILVAGESILIKKRTRVRYSNPFDEECIYISLCMPAFSIESVNREAE